MSWTDKRSIEHMKGIRDFCGIQEFVETGTFKGINAQVQADNFQRVLTCEVSPRYFSEAKRRLKSKRNVKVVNKDSFTFLLEYAQEYHKSGRRDIPLIYLDAHFYNKEGPRWQVQRELKALEGFRNCVIVIHDFNNGLGHCVYDGERLGMNVVGDLLEKVNPDFQYYTNNLETCDIMKPEETKDPVMKDNLLYAWTRPRLTYRGILYASPVTLPNTELIKWNSIFQEKLL